MTAPNWESAPLVQDERTIPAVSGWESAPIVEEQPAVAAPAPALALDLTRSGREVYADIQNLAPAERQRALDQWAELRIAKQREAEGGGVLPRLMDAGVNLARGQVFGSYLDEFGGWLQGKVHDVSGGTVGAPQEVATALYRARDRAISKERPIESGVTQLAGGLITGIPLFNALIAPRVAQGAAQAAPGMVRRMATGAAVGAPLGIAAGHGEGTGAWDDPTRIAGAKWGAGIAGGLGAVLPPVVSGGGWAAGKLSDAVSPYVARVGATASANLEALRRRLGLHASAYGPPAQPLAPGAEAAAEQVIANQLSRAGVTPAQLQARLSASETASLYHGGGERGAPGASYAQNALAPVDLDPSLQRLGGSVVRQSPEAGNTAGDFIVGRQTGLTPRSGPLPELTGIPTHPKLSVRPPDDKPMGQFERVKDALKRAFLLRDEKHHGHGANAYRTEQQIIHDARTEANALYGEAYEAGENVNLRAVIAPVLQKWRTEADNAPHSVGNAIRDLIKEFESKTGPITNIKRFQQAKEFADGKIQNWLESVEGRNRHVGGELNKLKNELLAAVDGVQTAGLGAKYAAARNAFSSRMEMRDALQLGRDVFREGSEVAGDQFRGLATAGEQKLFRLGLLGSFENHMGRQARTHDVTTVFDNPRIQGILEAAIPRVETSTGRMKMSGGEPVSFARRPERFGSYLDTEKSFITTRNETFGGSPTQKRIVDDEAYGTLNTLVERVRNAPNLGSLALNLAGDALNKVFGYRADTAAALARMLFTADPTERRRVLEAVARRYGPDRMQQFVSLIQQNQAAVTATGGQAAGGATEARGLLPGGEHRAAADDFIRVANRLADRDAAINTSRSATNPRGGATIADTNIAGTSNGETAGALRALGLGGTTTTAVIMSRPQYTRWATRYLQLRAGAARNPERMPELTTHIARMAAVFGATRG